MIRGEIKILKEVIEAVVHKITVSSIELTAPTAKIYTCNTLYLNTGKIVTISTVKYRVVSFVINEYIEVKPVKGSTLPSTSLTEFTIDNPKFYDGTPRRVTAENTLDKQVAGYNLPIIWLLMWVEIKAADDKRSSFITSTIQGANLFFLDDCNVKDWNQENHRIEIWEPMENEMWHIFKAIESRGDIFDRNLNEPDRRFHSNFGEYLTNKGYDGTILAGTFSGVQAIIDIPYIIDPCDCEKVEVCKPARFILNSEYKQDIASGSDFDLTVENESGDNPIVSYDPVTKTLITEDSGSSASIDVAVNGSPFYTGVSTNQNLPVKNSTGIDDVGSKVGSQWRIGDTQVILKNSADQTLSTVNFYAESQANEMVADNITSDFNTIPTQETPSGQNKSVIVQTVDANPAGNVIEDTPNTLRIEIQNSQVNVNGDAFESIPPESVLNVPILDTAGNTTGTNTGSSVEIGDSVISIPLNTPPISLEALRSQQNKAINLVDAIDNDPVSVTAIIDTESLAELIIPNSQVVVKNSAGTALYTKTVKAGGSADQIVSDASVSNSDDSYTSVVVAGVSKELPDITVTQPNGDTSSYPSVKDFACTLIGALADSDLISDLTDAQVVALYNGRVTINVIELTTLGAQDYTKPANLLYADVICIGAGGGGSSGARRANGTASAGGGGGGAGAIARRRILASDMAANETVTVGDGGTGGVAQTADNSPQIGGNAGGSTSFGALVVAVGGNGGQNGGNGAGVITLRTANTPNTSQLNIQGGAAVAGGTTGAGVAATAMSTSSSLLHYGGGGGGALSAATPGVEAAGGVGSRIYNNAGSLNTAAVGGLASGGAGNNGVDNHALQVQLYESILHTIGLGSSGSGGGSENAGVAGSGGNGGLYGAGGGGGGGSRNGNNSGAGGNGAQGCVIIYEFLV